MQDSTASKLISATSTYLQLLSKICTPREAHSAAQCFSVAHQGWGRVLLSTICTPTVSHGEHSSSLYVHDARLDNKV